MEKLYETVMVRRKMVDESRRKGIGSVQMNGINHKKSM